MSRSSIWWTGLAGLVGAVGLTAVCLFLATQKWSPALLAKPIYVWGLFLFLLFFSLVEIPVMIFSIRRIVASPNPKARYVALLITAGYPFFAAVYAAPFILLTGRVVVGGAMAALAVVRFVSALLFLPGPPRAVDEQKIWP